MNNYAQANDPFKAIGTRSVSVNVTSVVRQGGAPWLAPVVIIAAWSAMRHGEIRRLCWEWIDFGKGLIWLPGAVTKTKKGRGVVMLPIVDSCLQAWLGDGERPKTGLVFPSPHDEGRSLTENTMVSAFRRLMDQVFADLEADPAGTEDGDVERITFMICAIGDVPGLRRCTGMPSIFPRRPGINPYSSSPGIIMNRRTNGWNGCWKRRDRRP